MENKRPIRSRQGPLDWAPGFDWEIYSDEKPKRADLYHWAERIARVTSHTRLGLWWKMRKIDKRHGLRARRFG